MSKLQWIEKKYDRRHIEDIKAEFLQAVSALSLSCNIYSKLKLFIVKAYVHTPSDYYWKGLITTNA
jgi:hypothetical protein